eukprot:scaffold248674_cov28-Tisochrysis_lutea.AAC.3
MQAKRAVVSVDLPLRTKRGSNFGRVDALRWWLKLRHEGAPPCPGDCFLSQKSKRKPHERDMGDNLEVRRGRQQGRLAAAGEAGQAMGGMGLLRTYTEARRVAGCGGVRVGWNGGEVRALGEPGLAAATLMA